MPNSEDLLIPEFAAVDLMSRMERFGNEVLAPGSGRSLPHDEKVQLEFALRALRPTFDDLAKRIFDPLRLNDPAAASHGFGQLYELMRAAFLIGAHGAITESARDFFSPRIEKDVKNKQAALARLERSKKPAEIALKKAIFDIRGSGPAERPAKEAEAILDEVNRRLEGAGFGAVNVDVVRRRLEKFSDLKEGR